MNVYEFGKFRLDAEERLLLSGVDKVILTPKAFDTLLVLVENCGHMVTKEELMQRVWADSFVEENNLAQNISMLRKALGDTQGATKYIETVPKRGYRFLAQVRKLDTSLATLLDSKDHAAGRESTSGVATATAQTAAASPSPFPRPETHYAVSSGGVNIAYQVIGDAPLDLVFVMGWVSHLEYFWQQPDFARFLTRLASFSRLILFDKRGTGLSDRVPLNELPTLEQRMTDVQAVMDAVGSERAVLLGVSEGGPMCSLFAATHPDRTVALAMIGTYAKRIAAPDYPWAPTAEQREQFFLEMREHWGGPVGLDERAPSMAANADFAEWWSTYLRMGASPNAALALTRMNAEIDVRQVLPSIRVPTLVLHRSGDRCLKLEEGRYVAAQIPGATFVELPGVDHLPFVGDQEAILQAIEDFVTGIHHKAETDRVLATVLFTRIIRTDADASASERSALDELIRRHQSHARREVEIFKGREVESTNNGMLATFDGPARAIRCATAIASSATRLGIKMKLGLHTGECDVMGEKYSGIAVDIGAEIAMAGEVGEVFVSNTVKDLVAGSGIHFIERGQRSFEHALGEWRLFVVDKTPR